MFVFGGEMKWFVNDVVWENWERRRKKCCLWVANINKDHKSL